VQAAAAAPPGARRPRMVFFSGHDSTVTPLLVALGQPETAWPPFTACLTFELLERNGPGSSSGGAAEAALLAHGSLHTQTHSAAVAAAVAAVSGGGASRSLHGVSGGGSGGGSGALGRAGGRDGGGGPSYEVRVLYNAEPMLLEGSKPGGCWRRAVGGCWSWGGASHGTNPNCRTTVGCCLASTMGHRRTRSRPSAGCVCALLSTAPARPSSPCALTYAMPARAIAGGWVDLPLFARMLGAWAWADDDKADACARVPRQSGDGLRREA
jgi:hypothetical protein